MLRLVGTARLPSVMQAYPKRVPTTLALGLAISTLIMATAQAQDQSPGESYSQSSQSLFSVVEPQSKSALWINPGMASYHFDQNKNFNGANWGAGLEYRFNTVASITAGRFYNSDREYSNYAGLYYEPVAIGPIKLGAVIGGFSGYPAANNGGWFPAVLPALAWEGERVGANVFVIPTVGDRVHGAISLQLKFKIWE